MPVKNRIAEMHDEIAAWRRDFHEHPELLYDTRRTAAIVAAKLREFGCDEVAEGTGRTGVGGLIRGRSDASGRVVGIVSVQNLMSSMSLLAEQRRIEREEAG